MHLQEVNIQGAHALDEGSDVECHSPDERLDLTICPAVKNGSGMPSCVCQDVMSWAEADDALPVSYSFSSIWNVPCAKSGSRRKKDIDSLDGGQRQALVVIKGLWA